MDSQDFQFLQSETGTRILAELATTPVIPATHLSVSSRLREQVGAARAQVLLETAILRERASTKFSRASEMFFTRPALEQATAEPVARHRAQRFAAQGFELVADLGCSIGGDALALATVAEVIGLDRDPVRLQMARHNTAVYDVAERFLPVLADLLEMAPLPVEAFFLDPARRTAAGPREAPSRRLRSLSDYEPGFATARLWLARVNHAGIKVSPGIDYDELPEEAEVEFVSLNGELKEAVLWFGRLRTGASRRATLLPAGIGLCAGSAEMASRPITAPQAFLYEPDAAVIRAHLVQELAAELAGTLIDPEIAYITAPSHEPTPFARAYRLEDYFPFQLKRLRHYLRERRVGQVTIKKRGSPLDPEDLRRALRLQGDQYRVVFLTQVSGQATVLIGEAL